MTWLLTGLKWAFRSPTVRAIFITESVEQGLGYALNNLRVPWAPRSPRTIDSDARQVWHEVTDAGKNVGTARIYVSGMDVMLCCQYPHFVPDILTYVELVRTSPFLTGSSAGMAGPLGIYGQAVIGLNLSRDGIADEDDVPDRAFAAIAELAYVTYLVGDRASTGRLLNTPRRWQFVLENLRAGRVPGGGFTIDDIKQV